MKILCKKKFRVKRKQITRQKGNQHDKREAILRVKEDMKQELRDMKKEIKSGYNNWRRHTHYNAEERPIELIAAGEEEEIDIEMDPTEEQQAVEIQLVTSESSEDVVVKEDEDV